MTYYEEDDELDRRKAILGIGALGIFGVAGTYSLFNSDGGPSAATNTPQEGSE